MINSLEYNIIKELDIINVQALDMESDQTWLHSSVYSGKGDLDILKWKRECNWRDVNTFEYKQSLEENLAVLENTESGFNKQKFDSRTYTRPKKRFLRPSLHSVVQNYNNNNNTDFMCGTKTITKHSRPFNTNTITKYKEVNVSIGDEDMFDGSRTVSRHNGTYRLDSGDMSDDMEVPSVLNSCGDGPMSYTISKPININLSEPAHNLHNTFNKLIGNTNHRNDSLSNMSPPSLVSSIAMDGSGGFNSATFSRQGSMCSRKSYTGKDEEDFNGDDQTAQNSIDSMTISILDEKEMSTSMLSHCQDESLIGSLPPSMSSSIDTSFTNSTMGSTGHPSKNTMENSLINSGTFTTLLEPADENLPNGKPKFQLRKSFLKPDPDDDFDRFLMLNANCNTEDLRGLSGDLLKSIDKKSKCDTYRKESEKENLNSTFNKDDSFLLGDGMSDSFVKEIGRESLNITYNKMPHVQQRTRTVNRPQMEMDQTILLPNQVLSPRHHNKPLENNSTYTKKLNGTYDAIPKERESPKRNGTFRKITPPSNRNLTVTLINTDIEIKDAKDVEPNVVDSNKECYVSNEKLVDISGIEDPKEMSPTEKRTWTPHRRKPEGISMAGGSSDSLEQNSSGSCSPHRAPALNMDDLEHRAHEQEQKLYQVVSTPISKITPQDVGSANILFRQNALSPILNQPTEMVTSSSASSNISESPTEPIKYEHNSSSLGNLNRVAASSRRLLPVKRESSAPEIKASTPNSSRMPFSQKFGANKYQSGPKSSQGGVYGSDTGLYSSRSAGGSPAKSVKQCTSGLSRPLSSALDREHTQHLTGSDNELRPRKSGLPASKLRQYSSHKELNRIPEPPRRSVAGGLGALRPSSRLSFHASNPALCPAPLVRQASYTLVSKDGTRRDFARPAPPGLLKETTRHQVDSAGPNRLSTNLVSQTNTYTSGGGLSYGQPMRAKHNIGSMLSGNTRTSMAPRSEMNSQTYMRAPASKQPPSQPQSNLRPPSAVPAAQSQSAQRLPRPSGLPRPSSGIPKRPGSIRPPSTYSLAPRPGDQTSDCY